MADEVKIATCPRCGSDTFKYFDSSPEGYYHQFLFECAECKRCWAKSQLKGMESAEAPF